MNRKMPAGPHGLGRDLQWRLMLPLLAIVLATGAVGAWTAQQLTSRVFDSWLLDAAHSLAQLVRFDGAQARVDLPPAAATVLAYDDTDQTFYSVTQDGQVLVGQPSLPGTGGHEARYPRGRAYDSQLGGRAVRVVSTSVDDGQGHTATVRVAETLLKRQRAEHELLTVLWPVAVLVLATFAAIQVVVRRTVQPLGTIAARWNQRSHDSLQAIGAEDVPRELQPFAQALNDLLARIRAMLERERAFAATAAHQLRTPLAGLQLGLARAAEAPDMATTRKVLAELDQATQRHARLVRQLLLLGRLDPEMRTGLDFVETDLVALAQAVGASYLDAAERHGVTLELAEPPLPVAARAHAELLSEALGNLLENALRYTPAGGRVLVSFDAAPPSIHVSDSGPGIRAEERGLVFERYVRGRDALGDLVFALRRADARFVNLRARGDAYHDGRGEDR